MSTIPDKTVEQVAAQLVTAGWVDDPDYAKHVARAAIAAALPLVAAPVQQPTPIPPPYDRDAYGRARSQRMPSEDVDGMLRERMEFARPTHATRRIEKSEDWAQLVPLPPQGMETTICRCGGHYLSNPAGIDAHIKVFGHQPIPAEGGKQ